MVANAKRLRGKQVAIKFSGLPLTATVEDVDEIGVWIKGNLLRGENAPDISQPKKQATPNFENPISFVPWSQVEYIVTESERTP